MSCKSVCSVGSFKAVVWVEFWLAQMGSQDDNLFSG